MSSSLNYLIYLLIKIVSSSLNYLIYLRVKLCLECLIKIVSSSLTISVCQAILWMIDSDNWFYLQSISFNMLELSLYHQVFLKILDSDSVKKLHDTWVVNIKEYRCLTSKHFNDNVVFSQSCSWIELTTFFLALSISKKARVRILKEN